MKTSEHVFMNVLCAEYLDLEVHAYIKTLYIKTPI